MKTIFSIVFFAFISLFLHKCVSKRFDNIYSLMKFNSNSFHLLGKQTVNVGEYTVILKAKLSSSVKYPDPPSAIPFTINLFTDVRWSQARLSPSCKEKTQYSLDTVDMYVPSDGQKWSSPVELALNQTKRPVVWYFFFTDCEKKLPQYTDQTIQIEISLEITDEQGSFLAYEQNGKIPFNLIMIFAYLMVLFLALSNEKNALKMILIKNSEDFFSKPASFFLVFSIFFEILTLILEIFEVYKISHEGKGLYYCEFFSLLFNVISHFSIMLLCLLLASGWSLLKKQFEEDWEMYITLSVVILLFEIFMVGVDKAFVINNYALHAYEGVVMGLVIGIRVILWANFLFLLIKTFRGNKKSKIAHPLVGKFLVYFGICASLYFLALPFGILGVNFWVADYFKRKFLDIWNNSLQFFMIAGLTVMLCDAKSLYNTVRTKKKTEHRLPIKTQ